MVGFFYTIKFLVLLFLQCMEINTYLDATYLKTAQQANLSEEENEKIVVRLVEEAVLYNYKLVMLRANYITLAKK